MHSSHLHLFSSVCSFLVSRFLQLALPLPVSLQLSFPSCPVAFSEVSALLLVLLMAPRRFPTLFPGFDVLLEGDNGSIAAIGPRALRLPRRQHRLQTRVSPVVAGLFTVGGFLQNGRLLLLRLLDGLLWNVGEEDEEAVLTPSVLDQSADSTRTQLKQRRSRWWKMTELMSQTGPDSLWVGVRHPFPQNDKPLVSSVDRQTVPVHQDPLMTFGEVQRPETPADISM